MSIWIVTFNLKRWGARVKLVFAESEARARQVAREQVYQSRDEGSDFVATRVDADAIGARAFEDIDALAYAVQKAKT